MECALCRTSGANKRIKQCGHLADTPCGHFDSQTITLCDQCYQGWNKIDSESLSYGVKCARCGQYETACKCTGEELDD